MKAMKTLVLTSMIAAASISSASAAILVDISGSFNGDVLASSDTDSAGDGFGEFGSSGTADYKFRTDLSATPSFPASGGTFTADNSGPEFQLGPYNGNNAVMIEGSGSVTVDITNQSITTLYALHTAVFFNTSGDDDGTVTFNYTDASSSSALTWDLMDSDGRWGSEPVALTGSLDDLNGTSLFAGRQMYWGTFVNPDQGKTVDSITFSTVGHGDSDADFAVLALTNAIPEPSSAGSPCSERSRCWAVAALPEPLFKPTNLLSCS